MKSAQKERDLDVFACGAISSEAYYITVIAEHFVL